MFEFLKSLRKPKEAPIINDTSWNTGSTTVVTTEHYHSNVSFPTSWMGRIQTPVKRPPAGKMWSQPEWSRSDSWGGPRR